MRRRSVVFGLIFIVLISPLTHSFKGSELSKFYQKSVSSKFSQPVPESSYILIAAEDGKISLLDTSSEKVVWTFHTGERIYSSYQAPHYHYRAKGNAAELGDDFYMDCDNEWRLYYCTMHKGKCINETVDAQEYIGKLPYSLTDRVILGRKDTAAFLLDLKTGRLVKTYRLDDLISGPNVQTVEEKAIVLSGEAPLLLGSGSEESEYPRELIYIERKDYKLQCVSKFGDILWSVAFAEMDAKLQHHGSTQFVDGLPLLDSPTTASKGKNKFQLSYKKSAPVIRLRNDKYEKLLSKLGVLDGAFYFPFQDTKPQLAPADGNYLALPGNGLAEVLSLPLPEVENPEITNILDGSTTGMDFVSKFSDFFAKVRVQIGHLISVVVAILSAFGLAFCHSRQNKPIKQPDKSKMSAVIPKKKKPKKSKNIKSGNKKENGNVIGESKDLSSEGNEKKLLSTFPDLVSSQVDGQKVGKLFVTNKEIAKGSNGTVVLEGFYEGRPVAVKRLVQTHHDVAEKEILNLIDSDKHSNIVRWYGVDEDDHFIYISLERCTCNLSDLISVSSGHFGSQIASNNQINTVLEDSKGIELWKENEHPSPLLLKLMRDIVSGLAHLHEIGIIHRDLKPQNVLIVKDTSLRAKLSDMGISKRLPADTSALTRNATGSGSSGWQAPEQLRNERQTRAVDLFSLGCVLFFCMTAGKHPYGDTFERDVNILNDRKDFFLVESLPEVVDLLSGLLDPDPNTRPTAKDVLHHPLFWNSDMRLSFLRDASDRVELENREDGSKLLAELESTAMVTLNGKWDEKLDTIFIDNIGRYRRYKFDSIRDLLRVIRNKLNHYREFPQEIRELLGTVPEGFDHYFSSRFPKLLIEVYKVLRRYCKDEQFFQKYMKASVI